MSQIIVILDSVKPSLIVFEGGMQLIHLMKARKSGDTLATFVQ